MNDYQKYIHLSKYSRFRDSLGRRETWEETVDRYTQFFKDYLRDKISDVDRINTTLQKVGEDIKCFKVAPSMRALMTAGPALAREHACAYNCAAIAVDSPRVFDETFYLLLSGAGVGFSVERQFINKLPTIADELYPSDTVIVVHDSKLGWAKALKELIYLLYNGSIPKIDYSKLRPAGARLKTTGGRASGPQALELLCKRVIRIFQNAAGRKLNSLECPLS